MNTDGHQPLEITGQRERLAPDTIDGSFWFYILLTRTHIRTHISRGSIRPSSNPHVWYEGPARDMEAIWQHFAAFVCCSQLLRCSVHLHHEQTAAWSLQHWSLSHKYL